jgi:riboflavin kinase/FMN adenylyltransferase
MQIHRGIDNFPKLDFAILTSGTFDGVHTGHQKILTRLLEIKRQTPNSQTVVLTFFPHPRMVLQASKSFELLYTLEEKAAKLAELGIDHFLIIPFTKEFAKTSSKDYIQNILIDAINVRKLVIGYDHRFGRNREGGFDYLTANQGDYPFDIEEITRYDVEQIGVSSTRTREALLNGDVELAKEYLGNYYPLSGKVVEGERLGRTIGFPTANLEINEKYKLIPAKGVYAVKVKHKEFFYDGMLNIGNRPTISGALEVSIEVHIFDFDKNIYGQTIELLFVKKLREEKKYDNLEALKKQLYQDKLDSLAVLKKCDLV